MKPWIAVLCAVAVSVTATVLVVLGVDPPVP